MEVKIRATKVCRAILSVCWFLHVFLSSGFSFFFNFFSSSLSLYFIFSLTCLLSHFFFLFSFEMFSFSLLPLLFFLGVLRPTEFQARQQGEYVPPLPPDIYETQYSPISLDSDAFRVAATNGACVSPANAVDTSSSG